MSDSRQLRFGPASWPRVVGPAIVSGLRRGAPYSCAPRVILLEIAASSRMPGLGSDGLSGCLGYQKYRISSRLKQTKVTVSDGLTDNHITI